MGNDLVGDTIHQLFQATVTYWDAAITECGYVGLSYQDERADTTDDDSFPKLIISIYDEQWDGRRRLPGPNKVYSARTGPDVEITQKPVPVDYYFQLDLLAKKQRDLQTIGNKLRFLLGNRYSSITLPSSYQLHIIPEEILPMIGIDGLDIHRMVFRYYVQHWVYPYADPIDGNVILNLTIKYGLNDQVEVP